MSGHQPDARAADAEAVTGGGRTEAVPDAVESGPPGTRFTEIRRFSRLDSTNRYLLDVARRRPQPGLVAVAEHQSAGRGRLGRSWEAPPGANLLASVLLVPSMPVEHLHLCSVAVSLAAAEACHAVAGLEVWLKWPNDLVVADRKLAGVLAETVPLGHAGGGSPASRSIVVGVGINVRWPPPEGGIGDAPVPHELRASATSIARETGRDVAPVDLLSHLLVALEPKVDVLEEESGRMQLAHEYRRRCATVGRRVRVALADGEISGTAADITREGHLLVDGADGVTTVMAGDVVHLRGAVDGPGLGCPT